MAVFCFAISCVTLTMFQSIIHLSKTSCIVCHFKHCLCLFHRLFCSLTFFTILWLFYSFSDANFQWASEESIRNFIVNNWQPSDCKNILTRSKDPHLESKNQTNKLTQRKLLLLMAKVLIERLKFPSKKVAVENELNWKNKILTSIGQLLKHKVIKPILVS